MSGNRDTQRGVPKNKLRISTRSSMRQTEEQTESGLCAGEPDQNCKKEDIQTRMSRKRANEMAQESQSEAGNCDGTAEESVMSKSKRKRNYAIESFEDSFYLFLRGIDPVADPHPAVTEADGHRRRSSRIAVQEKNDDDDDEGLQGSCSSTGSKPRPTPAKRLVAIKAKLKEHNQKLKEEHQALQQAYQALQQAHQAQIHNINQDHAEVIRRLRAELASQTAVPTEAMQHAAAPVTTTPPQTDYSGCTPAKRQHPDIPLPELTAEQQAKIDWLSNGAVDRYGCLVFQAVIGSSRYSEYTCLANWTGTGGKWELPNNLKQYVLHAAEVKFGTRGPGQDRSIIDRIHELLRKPRKTLLV